jgi:hypothetical protein
VGNYTHHGTQHFRMFAFSFPDIEVLEATRELRRLSQFAM